MENSTKIIQIGSIQICRQKFIQMLQSGFTKMNSKNLIVKMDLKEHIIRQCFENHSKTYDE